MRSGFVTQKVPATPVSQAPPPLTGEARLKALNPDREFTEDELASYQANWEDGYNAGYRDGVEGRGRQF